MDKNCTGYNLDYLFDVLTERVVELRCILNRDNPNWNKIIILSINIMKTAMMMIVATKKCKLRERTEGKI